MLQGGEVIRASYWNTLFGELDAKLATLLGGRTFLLANVDYSQVMGKTFWFGAGPRSEAMGGQPYDHTPFTEAAADPDREIELFDEDKKIAAFKEAIQQGGGFFDGSIEAHQRLFNPHPEDPESVEEPFWLMEPDSYRPERNCSYGLAEVISESLATVIMPASWNKYYRFFRFHNLDAEPVKVEFRTTVDGATLQTVEVPAYGCRCVRRDTPTSGYLEGFNYFPKFKDGDPTVLYMPHDPATPPGSMGANTVINPSMLYTYLNLFSALRVDPVTTLNTTPVWRDPHELNDIGTLYQSYFAT